MKKIAFLIATSCSFIGNVYADNSDMSSPTINFFLNSYELKMSDKFEQQEFVKNLQEELSDGSKSIDDVIRSKGKIVSSETSNVTAKKNSRFTLKNSEDIPYTKEISVIEDECKTEINEKKDIIEVGKTYNVTMKDLVDNQLLVNIEYENIVLEKMHVKIGEEKLTGINMDIPQILTKSSTNNVKLDRNVNKVILNEGITKKEGDTELHITILRYN